MKRSNQHPETSITLAPIGSQPLSLIAGYLILRYCAMAQKYTLTLIYLNLSHITVDGMTNSFISRVKVFSASRLFYYYSRNYWIHLHYFIFPIRINISLTGLSKPWWTDERHTERSCVWCALILLLASLLDKIVIRLCCIALTSTATARSSVGGGLASYLLCGQVTLN